MGLGGQSESARGQELQSFTWKDIQEEKSKKWFVIDNVVYDITNFSKRHPGGERLLMNHVGQDVTEAFVAFHNDKAKVSKYLKPLAFGRIDETSDSTIAAKCQLNTDRDEIKLKFKKLRELAEKMNLFETNPFFYMAQFAHVIIMEIIAFYLLWTMPQSWLSFIVATILFTTVQAQAAWLQHDFGHLSVFKSSPMNHYVQTFLINFIMGFSGTWWNYRHYQHHAKPNIIRKDPDIRFGPLFMLGKTIPVELGKKKIGKLPYKLQQYYFFLIVPPLLMTIYFLFENIYYMIKHKYWKELAITSTYYIKFFIILVPCIGLNWSIILFFLARFLYSHWFVWVTQMNHLPMAIERDANLDWFSAQLQSTCNVEQSFFNDWFTGHLNFQIEHHLFPTMPRHNYYKIAPYARSLAKETNTQYLEKSLGVAMADIFISLRESGELWFDAYNS